MRRVAAIADVHGNAPALEAVLAEIAATGVDLVVDCGDLASGPLPEATLRLIAASELPFRCVRGNADSEVIAAFDDPAWTPAPDTPPEVAAVTRFAAARIGAGGRAVLDRSEPVVVVEVDGLGEVCFCHGTPRSESEIVTAGTPDDRVRAVLAECPQAVVVGGHTHMQLDRTVDARRLVNAGSVGMPYEGRPGAFWALLGPGVELRCTPYDIDAAATRIAASGYPGCDAFIAENLREPPGPEIVIPIFEGRVAR